MIINTSRKTILSPHERFCRNFLSQSWGLMFRRRQNLVLVFPQERRVSLQMFFVFYPITVLVVDKKGKVVEIKENFRPFTFWKAKEKGKYVVELGTMPAKAEVGDLLKLNI